MFLTSFSENVLLVYRNTTDFHSTEVEQMPGAAAADRKWHVPEMSFTT